MKEAQVYVVICDEGTDVEVSAGILRCERIDIVMREGRPGAVIFTVPIDRCDIQGKLASRKPG